MKVSVRRLLYLLVFVLAIGAILWLVPTDKPAPSEPSALPAIQLPTPESEEPPEPALTESTNSQPVKEEAAGIWGRVLLLEAGEGLDGAVVKVTWKEEEEPREVEKVTDAEGDFAVASRGARDYWIEVSYAALVSEERRYKATVHEDEPTPAVEIWMVPGGAISGRVYDSVTNEGIAGVKVGSNRKQSPGVTTDADGRYRLAGLRSGKKRIFLGHARGYIDPPNNSNGTNVSVSLGMELSDVDFPLQPGVFAAIEGKVVDERGYPVADAEVNAVRLSEMTHNYQSSSDKTKIDGTFHLAELQVAGGFYVTAKSEGHISEELGPLGLTIEGIHDLVLTLRPTGSISGQVVDVNSGRPVPEPKFAVDTMYTWRGRNSIGGRSDNLDENGNFEIVNLPPGPYGLFVDSHPNIMTTGMVRPQVTVDLEHGQHLTDIRLTFDYERYLQSKVAREARLAEPVRRDEPPKPHVGEVRGRVVRAGTSDAVTTFHLNTSHRHMGIRHSSRTVHDPDGRFTIDEKEGETLTIAIASKGYVPTEEVVQGGLGEQPIHDITVRLQPGSLVDGEVIDTSGNAVAGAAVYIGVDPSLMSTDYPGVTPDAVSGPDGSFRLDTLPETTMRIYASHPAFAVGSAEVRDAGMGPTQLKIVLGDGGALEGIVRRSGEPLTGQSIMVLNETRKNLQLTDNRTDNQGWFRLDHLTPGLYTLYTSIDEHSRTQYLDAEVEDGMITGVDFDFDETDNAVEGIVLLNGEQPSSLSVRAEIRTEIGLEKISTRFLRTGEYILTNLPLGEAEVTVHASQSDGFRASGSFMVSIAGGVIRHDLDLHAEE